MVIEERQTADRQTGWQAGRQLGMQVEINCKFYTHIISYYNVTRTVDNVTRTVTVISNIYQLNPLWNKKCAFICKYAGPTFYTEQNSINYSNNRVLFYIFLDVFAWILSCLESA